jgi:hypothetical protein
VLPGDIGSGQHPLLRAIRLLGQRCPRWRLVPEGPTHVAMRQPPAQPSSWEQRRRRSPDHAPRFSSTSDVGVRLTSEREKWKPPEPEGSSGLHAGRYRAPVSSVKTKTSGPARDSALTRLSELAGRPAFVPRATRRRQETVGCAGATNLQVRVPIRVSPQVASSVPRTLSRWRHGFKSRWDYKRKAPGQGTS